MRREIRETVGGKKRKNYFQKNVEVKTVREMPIRRIAIMGGEITRKKLTVKTSELKTKQAFVREKHEIMVSLMLKNNSQFRMQNR